MNETIKEFAKSKIREGLAEIPEEWQITFKLMYARGKRVKHLWQRSVEEAKLVPLDQVVDEIPDEKLDWALTQIENSLKSLEKQAEARIVAITPPNEVLLQMAAESGPPPQAKDWPQEEKPW